MSVCVYYSFDRLFPNIEGVTLRNENCNVCMCIYYHDHIFPQRGEGWLTENENCNVCMCILFPLITYFPRHGGGCSQKWGIAMSEWVYYSPWSPTFPDMERVPHRNENCNVCICIFFLWSPFSPTWRELLIEMRDADVLKCILLPWSHISPTWRGLLTEMRIAMSARVYYSLITYFHNMEGVSHRNENCTVCTCILFPWSAISTTWKGFLQKWELQCLYVYILPLITHFLNMEWVAERNDELQCLYVYIIPLIAYFQT